MKNKLIALATEIAKSDFAMDYDDSVELTLADALTILVMESVDDDIESDEVYDLIDGLSAEPVEKQYTEDDLREAFYKGREQACLPDEKSTTIFIRPTFNGYLRELDGNECPHENFKLRVASLINNIDYDRQVWQEMYEINKFVKKHKKNLE
jgi:hypothetical protein